VAAVRSKLAAQVYQWADNPADCAIRDGGLPLQLVMQTLLGVEDELLRDYDLSDQNRRVDKFEIPLSSPTFTVPRADYSGAVYAYMQTDPSSDLWWPVEIANHGAINQAGWDSRRAVGFYGTPPKGEVSWEPKSGHRLRVWFDRSGEDNPSIGGETDIAGLYDSHLALQAGAQCRELMGLPVGEVMKARLLRGEQQWRKSVTTSRQQGVIAKTPVFMSSRHRRGSPVDHSRFFVPR
jgi:hypothetical protein